MSAHMPALGPAVLLVLVLGTVFERAAVGTEVPAVFTLTSGAFVPGGEIPTRHSCEGDDAAPPLAWSGAPAGTRSLALVVEDPDAPDPAAPTTPWVHWVLYDLPPATEGLPAGATRALLPVGAREGLNDWKRPGYRGPCPPVGRHRYVHRLYALDVVLPEIATPTKAALEQAMHGHVLAEAQLIGTYQKHGR